MTSGFAPEFLILVGIDVFLGASILTVLLDKHFPAPLPYVLEGASLIGFAELMSGPTFLTSFSTELQFYYSFTYALISVLTLFATNLYLLFLRRRPFESAVLGITGTIPAGLGILYFTSAFVNGLNLSLPLVPVIPIQGVYAMFGLSIGLIVFSLVVFGRRVKPTEPVTTTQRPLSEPIISRASPETGLQLLAQSPPQESESQGQPEGLNQTGPEPPAHRPERPESDSSSSAEGHSGGAHGSGNITTVGASAPSLQPIPSPRDQGRERKDDQGIPNSSTVLVKKTEMSQYAKRLVDSIKFFEKAVDHPVRIDPKLLGGTLKGARKAYLTPAGMLLVEDANGKSTSLSLLDISTDEALQVMRQAIKGLTGSEELP